MCAARLGPGRLSMLREAHAADLEGVRALFREYAEWLGVDLCFQSFEEEIATLPGKYAPPKGRLLIAEVEGRLAGVVAEARTADYRAMRLDTLPTTMLQANHLYDRLGFREIPPYYENPVPNVRYLELLL